MVNYRHVPREKNKKADSLVNEVLDNCNSIKGMSSPKKLKNEVLKTLAYSEVFKYPLSFYQLGTYLGCRCSYKDLVKALRKLEKRRIISQKAGKYCVAQKYAENWPEKLKETARKTEQARDIIKRLEKIPWIKLLALTGPLAASNPQEKGDVDVFVVAQKKRLWLTRLFVVLYLKYFGEISHR